MGSLMEARGNINVVDIRYLNKENLDSWIDSAMRDFFYDAEIFNHIRMNGNLQPTLLDLMMTNEALKKELNNPWNANLPGYENLSKQLILHNTEDSVETKREMPFPKKAKLESDIKNIKDGFLKVTPKFERIEKKNCEFCDRTYLSAKALEAHRSKKHHYQQFQNKIEKDKDQVTCRACKPHKKILRDQIITHLKRVHTIVKPEGSDLRGWETIDDGKTYKPAFRHPHDPDLIEASQDFFVKSEDMDDPNLNEISQDLSIKTESAKRTKNDNNNEVRKKLFVTSSEAIKDMAPDNSLNLVKAEVEQATGSWLGSESQYDLADEKFAAEVRSSFETYEQNSDDSD